MSKASTFGKGELSDKSDSSSTGFKGAESDSLRSLGAAKVLQGVEKSYDPGKFVLDKSAELRLPEENQASAEDEPEESGRADTTLARQGTGEKTADDVAQAADLWTKAWGPDAREERRRMRGRAESIAAKLNLDNVEILEDAGPLSGERARAKGFFNPLTGKITIILANHDSADDVEQTLLHEAVGHYGLRRLFGKARNSLPTRCLSSRASWRSAPSSPRQFRPRRPSQPAPPQP